MLSPPLGALAVVEVWVTLHWYIVKLPVVLSVTVTISRYRIPPDRLSSLWYSVSALHSLVRSISPGIPRRSLMPSTNPVANIPLSSFGMQIQTWRYASSFGVGWNRNRTFCPSLLGMLSFVLKVTVCLFHWLVNAQVTPRSVGVLSCSAPSTIILVFVSTAVG